MTTASIIRGKQPRPDSIHFETSHLLREQHFGGGEGQKILFEEEKGLTRRAHYAQGKFPIDYSRNRHFPGGESLNRVAARAEKAIDTLLYPLLVQGKADGKKRVIAIISHGTFITELVAAIGRRDNDPKSTAKVAVRYLPGMPNASWIRLEVTLKACQLLHWQQSRPLTKCHRKSQGVYCTEPKQSFAPVLPTAITNLSPQACTQ